MPAVCATRNRLAGSTTSDFGHGVTSRCRSEGRCRPDRARGTHVCQAGVGDVGAIDNPPELLRYTVNVLRLKPRGRAIAGDAFKVGPLHPKTPPIARHHHKHRCVVVAAEALLEAEPG